MVKWWMITECGAQLPRNNYYTAERIIIYHAPVRRALGMQCRAGQSLLVAEQRE